MGEGAFARVIYNRNAKKVASRLLAENLMVVVASKSAPINAKAKGAAEKKQGLAGLQAVKVVVATAENQSLAGPPPAYKWGCSHGPCPVRAHSADWTHCLVNSCTIWVCNYSTECTKDFKSHTHVANHLAHVASTTIFHFHFFCKVFPPSSSYYIINMGFLYY